MELLSVFGGRAQSPLCPLCGSLVKPVFTRLWTKMSHRDALALTMEVGNLIHASPKRLSQFHHLRDSLSPGSPQLKPLCPTRWTVRNGAIDTVLKNYSTILAEFEAIGAESQGEASHKALGLLALMERFSTYFGLKLSVLVFGATEQFSATLQYRGIMLKRQLVQ